MSILWLDDFKTYGNSDRLIDGTYWQCSVGPGRGPIADPDPNVPAGSRCLNTYSASFVVPRVSKKVGVAFRTWNRTVAGGGAMQDGFLCRFSSSGAAVYSLNISNTGVLSVYRHTSPAGTLASTTTPIVQLNQWSHLEMMVNTETGAIEVRREGIPISELTLTDPNTAPNVDIARINFDSVHNLDATALLKDFILWDGADAQGFVGPLTIYDCSPDGDVSSGWSRSSGSSDAALINEAGPPNDTSLISAGKGPLPAPSIMTMKNLPVEVVAVRAIMTQVRARKIDGGDGNLQVSLLSGAGKAAGVNRPITTAFSYWSDVSQKNPVTNLPWTPVEVDNANLEIDRTV